MEEDLKIRKDDHQMTREINFKKTTQHEMRFNIIALKKSCKFQNQIGIIFPLLF